MISKKKLTKINRLKRRKEMLEMNINSIKQTINSIDKKLFTLIVRKN